MQRNSFAALSLAAFALCVVRHADASDYGRTSGSFDVSSSGSATYSIPIWTPPGPNGVTPSISLNYSSQGGNGLGGVGWNLSPGSSIERCGRNKLQDGNAGPVELTASDRYCMGGSRLRLSSGTYGAAGSIYLTEIADYSRITAYGTAGNGPEYFIVEAKSGLKYEYGRTTNSRVFPGVSPTISTTAVRWMLNKVSDRNGNNYVISYNNLNGFAVPDVISWTPTYLGSPSYSYEAKFNYFTARTDIDAFRGRVAGFEVRNYNRLTSIQIKSNGTVVRKYVFAYDTSTVTSRSRLTSAKECADDAESNCFLPITFSYQTGVAGVTAGAGAAPAGSSTNRIGGRFDFNGDGKEDIIYNNGATWFVGLGANVGFAGPYNTGITGTALPDRFVPNGRDGILTIVSGVLWVYRWDDATSSFVGVNTGIASAAPNLATDFDGDGLADLLYYTAGNPTVSIRRNNSTGVTTPSFDSSLITNTLPSPKYWGSFATYINNGLKKVDFNGDGRQDLYAVIVTPNPPSASVSLVNLLAQNTGYLSATSTESTMSSGTAFAPALNFNGDKCTDLILITTVYISPCKGAAASSLTAPAAPDSFLDWNGDGKTDLLVDSGGTYGVYLSTGAGFSSLVATSIPAPGGSAIDQDGDGLDDLIRGNGAGTALSYWTHTASGSVPTFSGNVPDLLSSVTDGFGVNHTPNYVSTASSNYDKGVATAFPLQEAEPSIVVAQVTSSNGIGGTYNKNYFYVGARNNAERSDTTWFQSSGNVGFQRVDETDGRNGLITRTYYEQTHPVSGMVSQVEVMQPNGVTPISRQVFINTFATLDATTNNQRYFVYASGSTDTQYEVGGTWNGALLRTVTTANAYENTGGTLYDQTVTTTEPAGSNGVMGGGSWVARTYLPLANLVNDTGAWCLGRAGQIQQINSNNWNYPTAITRTTNMAWDTSYCRPTQEVVEPGSGVLQVTTDFGYDGFGNVNSTTVTGVGMTARTTTALYSNATFLTGQFPLSTTNALSQQTTLDWNYDLGVPNSVTDPNDLATIWDYDAFGRRVSETRPDATYTTWDYLTCTSCDPRVYMKVDMNVRQASSTVFARSVQFLDQFDRSVIEHRLRADGNFDVTTRIFDSLGRVSNEYFPYSSSGSIGASTTTLYDIVSRPTSISRPWSDSNPAVQTTLIDYLGLTTKIRDAKLKESLRIVNAAGQFVRSVDHNGYYVRFDYDSFGGLKRARDSLSNDLQSYTYNTRGMLRQRVDIDMGTWNFTPNALGETVSQTDAKSQTTTFVFDLLGRLKTRTEAEGTSTWTWGTSNASNDIGRLASVSGPGYSESYVYDFAGRPSSTTVNADTTYQIAYSYNDIGALETLTYPASTGANPLKLKYEYQNGFLNYIKECAAPACTTYGTTYWRANSFNARSQITQETLGNTLQTNRAYDAVTGLLKSIQTGPSGGTGIQNLTYEWDEVGNLWSRKDVNQSNLTETFVYDNLYRVTSSSLSTGGTNLTMTYDALGNIGSKTGVGTYTYHASKKHQVMSTSGGWTFGYDNNGNMTGGRGATLTWTSYNYPLTIGNGTNTSAFSYTPDRQYWKQVSNYSSGGAATTIYVGGLLEKVITSGGTSYRHMIRAGGSTIIVSRPTVGSNVVYYGTSDHLGSSSAITNSAGALLVNSSFDAFGQRRGSNWTGNPSAGDWTQIANTTRRGYTEHSMLDNLNLIHMNGRVQDPLLGRFVSADPYITEPEFTQNYNRYSYVYNNPLSFTDPSGFCQGLASGTRRDGDDDEESAPSEQECEAIREQIEQGQARSGDSSKLPEIEVCGDCRTEPSLRFFFLNSSDQVAATFGDNSWSLAIWNVTIGGASEAANSAVHGDYGDAAIAATTALIKPLKAVKTAARAGETIFKTAHYTTRLEKAGVGVARAEAAVAKQVQAIRGSMNVGGDVSGRMQIDNVLIEYRARLLPDGSLNVGTIFPVGP